MLGRTIPNRTKSKVGFMAKSIVDEVVFVRYGKPMY